LETDIYDAQLIEVEQHQTHNLKYFDYNKPKNDNATTCQIACAHSHKLKQLKII